MKICKKHWEACRKAIDDRGLSHLIKTGEQNMETAVAQLEGKRTGPDTYDPLMALNYMLWGRGMEIMGLQAMVVDESKEHDDEANNGHICVLCEAEKSFHVHVKGECKDPHCQQTATAEDKSWDQVMIDGASDAILDYCKAEKLVTVQ